MTPHTCPFCGKECIQGTGILEMSYGDTEVVTWTCGTEIWRTREFKRWDKIQTTQKTQQDIPGQQLGLEEKIV